MHRTSFIVTFVILACSMQSMCAELPFSVPNGFTQEHTGHGDEGASIGKLTNAARSYDITYSVGGMWVPKPRLQDNDSLDAMVYFHETQVDGVAVQFDGYKIDDDGGNGYRVFMRVYSQRIVFTVDVIGRVELGKAIRDLEAFTFKKSDKSEEGAAPNF